MKKLYKISRILSQSVGHKRNRKQRILMVDSESMLDTLQSSFLIHPILHHSPLLPERLAVGMHQAAPRPSREPHRQWETGESHVRVPLSGPHLLLSWLWCVPQIKLPSFSMSLFLSGSKELFCPASFGLHHRCILGALGLVSTFVNRSFCYIVIKVAYLRVKFFLSKTFICFKIN